MNEESNERPSTSLHEYSVPSTRGKKSVTPLRQNKFNIISNQENLLKISYNLDIKNASFLNEDKNKETLSKLK